MASHFQNGYNPQPQSLRSPSTVPTSQEPQYSTPQPPLMHGTCSTTVTEGLLFQTLLTASRLGFLRFRLQTSGRGEALSHRASHTGRHKVSTAARETLPSPFDAASPKLDHSQGIIYDPLLVTGHLQVSKFSDETRDISSAVFQNDAKVLPHLVACEEDLHRTKRRSYDACICVLDSR